MSSSGFLSRLCSVRDWNQRRGSSGRDTLAHFDARTARDSEHAICGPGFERRGMGTLRLAPRWGRFAVLVQSSIFLHQFRSLKELGGRMMKGFWLTAQCLSWVLVCRSGWGAPLRADAGEGHRFDAPASDGAVAGGQEHSGPPATKGLEYRERVALAVYGDRELMPLERLRSSLEQELGAPVELATSPLERQALPAQKTEAPSPSALREAPPAQDIPAGPQGTAESEGSAMPRPSRIAPPSGRASSGVLEARSAPPPSAQALYDAAHRLHFGGVDRIAAVEAWDRYLKAYPSGQLAIEARYNRGIALARVGRTAEARRALTPFAQGEYGGYRQREARRLIEYLDASSTAPASTPLPSAPTR